MNTTFWVSVKSSLRQWYVSAAAFALIGLLDLVTNLQVPTSTKNYIVITGALALVKLADKALRQWILAWAADAGEGGTP